MAAVARRKGLKVHVDGEREPSRRWREGVPSHSTRHHSIKTKPPSLPSLPSLPHSLLPFLGGGIPSHSTRQHLKYKIPPSPPSLPPCFPPSLQPPTRLLPCSRRVVSQSRQPTRPPTPSRPARRPLTDIPAPLQYEKHSRSPPTNIPDSLLQTCPTISRKHPRSPSSNILDHLSQTCPIPFANIPDPLSQTFPIPSHKHPRSPPTNIPDPFPQTSRSPSTNNPDLLSQRFLISSPKHSRSSLTASPTAFHKHPRSSPTNTLDPILRISTIPGVFSLIGARLWNAAVALDVRPSELVTSVDTVSVCLSKGLGAPVGSVLVGSAEFIAEVRFFRYVNEGLLAPPMYFLG